MEYFEWVNGKIKSMEWYDISLIKLSSAAFALLVAKLWTPLLSLEWYWYGTVAILAGLIPLYKMFK